jgi:hypothetical protein
MHVNMRHLAWIALAFLLSCAVGGFLFGYAGPVEAKQEEAPYVPQVIPSPQEHAWCYVLVNDQNKLVGDIHTLSCVPKE